MSEATSPISLKTSLLYPSKSTYGTRTILEPHSNNPPNTRQTTIIRCSTEPCSPNRHASHKPQIPIPPPPMLRFGDIITVWLPVGQLYVEQVSPNQRVALLYTLLETTHTQLDTTNTSLEAAIEAI